MNKELLKIANEYLSDYACTIPELKREPPGPAKARTSCLDIAHFQYDGQKYSILDVECEEDGGRTRWFEYYLVAGRTPLNELQDKAVYYFGRHPAQELHGSSELPDRLPAPDWTSPADLMRLLRLTYQIVLEQEKTSGTVLLDEKIRKEIREII